MVLIKKQIDHQRLKISPISPRDRPPCLAHKSTQTTDQFGGNGADEVCFIDNERTLTCQRFDHRKSTFKRRFSYRKNELVHFFLLHFSLHKGELMRKLMVLIMLLLLVGGSAGSAMSQNGQKGNAFFPVIRRIFKTMGWSSECIIKIIKIFCFTDILF